MSNEEKPLQRITELTICGEKYELAANGQAYLVERKKKDAYGNLIAEKIDLHDPMEVSPQFVQDLLDHLVAAHRQLQTSRDARLGVGTGKDNEK